MKIVKENAIFKSIQGEGSRIGEPAYFLRLWGCSLGCDWCDTKESWVDEDNYIEVDPYQLAEDLKDAMNDVPRLVITGGEPFDQIEDLISLIYKINQMASRRTFLERPLISVETASRFFSPYKSEVKSRIASEKEKGRHGFSTFEMPYYPNLITFSPKLWAFTSDDIKCHLQELYDLGSYCLEKEVKIVVFDDADLRRAENLLDYVSSNFGFPEHRLIIQIGSDLDEEQEKCLLEADAKYRRLPQLQTLWGIM